jgi:hypothetical protein
MVDEKDKKVDQTSLESQDNDINLNIDFKQKSPVTLTDDYIVLRL